MTTLTDTQLVMLSSAAQREDHAIVLPERLKGQAARNTVERLLGRGLVEEIAGHSALPVWRRDEEGGHVLRITAAGLAAIGIEPAAEEGGDAPAEDRPGVMVEERLNAPGQPQAAAPRSGSKQALLVSLLSREEGATLDDLTAATDWLPHTARAALTGLRQKGHALTSDKEKGGARVYRIGTSPSGGAEQAAE